MYGKISCYIYSKLITKENIVILGNGIDKNEDTVIAEALQNISLSDNMEICYHYGNRK